MAHECPQCYQACYCGGDIDDCFFEGTKEQLMCGHCPDDEDENDEDYLEQGKDGGK